MNPNIDWKDRFGEHQKKWSRNGSVLETSNSLPSDECRSVPLSSLGANLSMKKKVCQVCNYKNMGRKWKSVVMCSRHGGHAYK